MELVEYAMKPQNAYNCLLSLAVSKDEASNW